MDGNKINQELSKIRARLIPCYSTVTEKLRIDKVTKSPRNTLFKVNIDDEPFESTQQFEQETKTGVIWNNEKEEKTFISNIFADHGFPKRPSMATVAYCRPKNGKNILEIKSDHGLPYRHDKDLINFISSMVIKNHERELYFPSKADLLREMGKVPHSETTKRLLDSIFRLRNTTFTFHDNVNGKDPFVFQIFKSVNPAQQSITLTVTEEFYNHLTKKKIKFDSKSKKKTESLSNVRPVDRRMLQELKNCPTALDTFTFVGLRALGKTARMNIADFMGQIQTGIQSTKQFVKSFSSNITKKIGKAFKKVYNIDLPKNLFKIYENGRGTRKSFTLEIKGGCQLVPPQTS